MGIHYFTRLGIDYARINRSGVNFFLSFILSSFQFLTDCTNLPFLPPLTQEYTPPQSGQAYDDVRPCLPPIFDEAYHMATDTSSATNLYTQPPHLYRCNHCLQPDAFEEDLLPSWLLRFFAVCWPAEDDDHQYQTICCYLHFLYLHLFLKNGTAPNFPFPLCSTGGNNYHCL